MRLLKGFYEFIKEEFKVGDIDIPNIDKYLDEMSKGLSDKLYFLSIVDVDILIDFGCADGILLNYISKVKPNIKLVGYDLDEYMINIAQNKYRDIQFESEWSKVEEIIEQNKNLKIGILLSSVIHEVYSYSKSNSISYFWNNQVFNNNIDYVIIRDMIPSSSYNKMNMIDVNKIREKSDKKYLSEYEKHWGNIGTDFRILLHWLLKYKYVINWKRELKENYLPITLEFLKSKWIPKSWSIQYEYHYVYGYIKNQIKNDFGVELNEPTHLKMIIKNNNK